MYRLGTPPRASTRTTPLAHPSPRERRDAARERGFAFGFGFRYRRRRAGAGFVCREAVHALRTRCVKPNRHRAVWCTYSEHHTDQAFDWARGRASKLHARLAASEHHTGCPASPAPPCKVSTTCDVCFTRSKMSRFHPDGVHVFTQKDKYERVAECAPGAAIHLDLRGGSHLARARDATIGPRENGELIHFVPLSVVRRKVDHDVLCLLIETRKHRTERDSSDGAAMRSPAAVRAWAMGRAWLGKVQR